MSIPGHVVDPGPDPDELRARISELEETLSAIRLGGVDAVLVGAPGAEQLYTLSSAERPYRTIVDHMSEGACTVSERHIVLFANARFSEMVGCERPAGMSLSAFVPREHWAEVAALLSVLPGAQARIETELGGRDGVVPVSLSSSCLALDGVLIRCLIATDDTERRAAHVQLERLVAERTEELDQTVSALTAVNHTLTVVSRGEHAMMHATDEREFIDEICRVVVEAGDYPLVWVGCAKDDSRRSVEPLGAAGETAVLEKAFISWAAGRHGDGPTGRAIRSQETQVDHDVTTLYDAWGDNVAALGLRSACAIPLRVGGARCALTIFSRTESGFDPASLSLLEGLASDLVYGLSRLQALSKLRRSLDSTITAVSAASELRDPYTAGHQRRVAQLAAAVCRRLGLAEEEVEGVETAATIHDIGKLVVPAEILSKPGRLTPQERALVMTHPQAGYDLVKGIDFPWPVADMVLQHHERLDGSGYPQGLVAEDLAVGSRVVCVADVVEAMSSHRPYRPALGLAAALAEVEAHRGVLYDRDVVDACVFVCRQAASTFSPSGSERFATFDSSASDAPGDGAASVGGHHGVGVP